MKDGGDLDGGFCNSGLLLSSNYVPNAVQDSFSDFCPAALGAGMGISWLVDVEDEFQSS